MNQDAEQRTDSQVKGRDQAELTSANQIFFLIIKMFKLENYLIHTPSAKISSHQRETRAAFWIFSCPCLWILLFLHIA